MKTTAMKLLRFMAIGLGKDVDFFVPWFDNECLSTFRSIHYLPRGQADVRSDQLSEDDLKLTTPAHADSGFITLLTTFGFPGLQVLIDGEYRSIKPQKNCIVVNLGETFARITNFKLKATSHRVLDIGIERYSSPFFLDPKYTAVIPSNILTSEEQEVEEPIVYGPWLIRNMTRKYKEWEGFLAAAGLAEDV
jgi:isopenicillin N synthase-like dioxygenase